jgi:hypothetical protein
VSAADQLLHHVASWPSVRASARGSRVSFVTYGSQRALGTLDLGSGVLEVDMPPDVVPSVLRSHPELDRSATGVRMALTDAGGLETAEWLLHRRVAVERFARQYMDASP